MSGSPLGALDPSASALVPPPLVVSLLLLLPPPPHATTNSAIAASSTANRAVCRVLVISSSVPICCWTRAKLPVTMTLERVYPPGQSAIGYTL